MHLKITEVSTTFNGILIKFDKDHTFIPWTVLTKCILEYFKEIEKIDKETDEEE